jgi:hypothetical protein
VGGQRHAPAALPPEHPVSIVQYRRLGETQDQFGCARKISLTPGFDPWTAQPVASSYTVYATPAYMIYIKFIRYTKNIHL